MPHFFLMLITRSFRHALSSLLKRNMLSLGSTRADQSRTGNGCVCICAIETEGKEKINKHVRMGLGRPQVSALHMSSSRANGRNQLVLRNLGCTRFNSNSTHSYC